MVWQSLRLCYFPVYVDVENDVLLNAVNYNGKECS